MTKELKKKEYIAKSQNIKQAIGIQLTVMLHIKLKEQKKMEFTVNSQNENN